MKDPSRAPKQAIHSCFSFGQPKSKILNLQVQGISKCPEILWALECDWHVGIFLGRGSVTCSRFSKVSLNLKEIESHYKALRLPSLGRVVDSEAGKRGTVHSSL